MGFDIVVAKKLPLHMLDAQLALAIYQRCLGFLFGFILLPLPSLWG